MKRKHWQGYGTVDMKIIDRTPGSITIKVKGNHEYGLSFPFYDTYRLTEWMGKLGGFTENQVRTYTSYESIEDDIDVCVYEIKLRRNQA